MADKRKSLFRSVAGWLHLWLGLASGIVVLIVSVTGCLFVFQEEISDVWYKKTFFVQPEQTQPIPLSIMQMKAQAVLGISKPILNIVSYPQPDRAWEFMTYYENDSAISYFGELVYFKSVFINPYNGEVTGVRDYRMDFFNIVKSIHWSLLLSTRYGQPIVGWGTMIFLILLITGLVLWYPKKWNRITRQQAFKIKWKAGFKRLNYDLHNVPGFYSMLLALVLAVTGLVFSFTWFEKFVYAVASWSTDSAPVEKEIKSDPGIKTLVSVLPIDIAYHSAVLELKDAQRIGITPAGAPASTINFYGYKKSGVYYDYDEVKFDQFTGKFLGRRNGAEKNRGEKLLAMNYDIHVGAIGGLTGKIIAFIVSLICASLPVTGFIVWLHKRKKISSPRQ